jgi:hypothetical protein
METTITRFSGWLREHPGAMGWFAVLTGIGGYTWMHVFFFGVPHFSLSTEGGLIEIKYALSTLAYVAICVGASLYAVRQRRKARG